MVPERETAKLKVIINPKNLSPRHDGAPCEMCNQNVAMLTYHAWDAMGKEKLSEHPVCSLCMLYESPWGQKRAPELREVIADLEKAEGRPFVWSADNSRLMLCSEANLVMGSIGLSSQLLFAMQSGEIDPAQVHELMLPPQGIRPEDLLKKGPPLITEALPSSSRGATVIDNQDKPS